MGAAGSSELPENAAFCDVELVLHPGISPFIHVALVAHLHERGGRIRGVRGPDPLAIVATDVPVGVLPALRDDDVVSEVRVQPAGGGGGGDGGRGRERERESGERDDGEDALGGYDGGSHDDGAVLSIGSLAERFASHGLHEEALALHELAYSIEKDASGADSPKLARHLQRLGAAYEGQGKTEAALGTLDEARAILEQAHGAEDPEVIALRKRLEGLIETFVATLPARGGGVGGALTGELDGASEGAADERPSGGSRTDGETHAAAGPAGGGSRGGSALPRSEPRSGFRSGFRSGRTNSDEDDCAEPGAPSSAAATGAHSQLDAADDASDATSYDLDADDELRASEGGAARAGVCARACGRLCGGACGRVCDRVCARWSWCAYVCAAPRVGIKLGATLLAYGMMVVFLSLLLARLDGHLQCSWLIVFAPLWITDAVMLAAYAHEFGRLWAVRHTASDGVPLRPRRTDLIDALDDLKVRARARTRAHLCTLMHTRTLVHTCAHLCTLVHTCAHLRARRPCAHVGMGGGAWGGLRVEWVGRGVCAARAREDVETGA